MPRPRRFAHVVLQTYDLDRLVDWYAYAFELEIVARSDRAVIATYDEEHHRFAFTQLQGEPPASSGPNSLKHVAYAYDGLADLVAQYKHMKERGHLPAECVNHGPTMSMYYHDPDGNGVEFFIDKFKTMEESKAYMASPSFQKNLFGHFFDPEVVVRQFESGELSEEEICRYDQDQADELLARQRAPGG